jgi:ABC-2 type transport system permease protein
VKGYEDNETAQGDLSQGRLSAVLVIPGDFGEGCSSYRAAPSEPSLWVNTSIRLYLDSGSMMVTQAIPHLVNNALSVTIYGELPQAIPSPIHLESPSLVEARNLSTFDYMAPGLFPFAAIFLTMLVAQSFVYERQTGLLRRILVTPTSSAEFMLAQVLSNMVVALAQVALVFAGAFLVGYRPYVDAPVLAFSFLIVSAFSLCCIGFGLVTATIAKSDGVATGMSFLFIMPQMLLGTFVPMGGTQLGRIAARFMPSHYVTDALTSLLLRGAAITSSTILFDAAFVLVSGILILVIGVVLFEMYGKA